MKTKLLTLFLLLFAAAPVLRAQFVPDWEPGDLKKKGTKIAVRGEKLDKASTYMLLEDFGGEEMSAKWRRDVHMRNWGIGLTAGGAALTAFGMGYGGVYILAGIVGTIFVAPFGKEAVDDLWKEVGEQAAVGNVITVAGTVTGITGIVLWATGGRHLKKTVKHLNEVGRPTESEIVFGPVAPDRMGFAYRF